MTNPDELERAVERVTACADDDEAHWSLDPRAGWAVDVPVSDLRLILAANRKMREGLMAAQSFIADGGLAESEPGASIYRQVTAALSTKEQPDV